MPNPGYTPSFGLNPLFYFATTYMVSIFLFCLGFKRRRFFYILLIITVASVLVFGLFFPYSFVYGLPLGTFIAALMIFAGMCFMFEESVNTIASALLLGVVANHACFSIWSIVILNIDPFSSFSTDWPQLLSGIAYFGGAFALIYFVFVRRITSGDVLGFKSVRQKIGSIIFVATIIILPSLCRYFEAETIFTRLYESFACLIYLFIEVYINIQARSETEKAEVEALLASEEKQRALSEASAEMVNIKAHDLKHKLSMLQSDDAASLEEIRETEEIIAQYDLLTNTGNKAFDAVVAEKAASMRKHNIKFTCTADVAAIDFMSPSDVYSFFGNALSNAYEASRLVKAKNKRFISMYVKQSGSFSSIHIENYTEIAHEFDKGLPKSTKKDKKSHGYGTRSMLYIVNKYHGHLTMRENDGIFEVDAIFERGRTPVNN